MGLCGQAVGLDMKESVVCNCRARHGQGVLGMEVRTVCGARYELRCEAIVIMRVVGGLGLALHTKRSSLVYTPLFSSSRSLTPSTHHSCAHVHKPQLAATQEIKASVSISVEIATVSSTLLHSEAVILESSSPQTSF